jgi:uncharacterized protein YkwD
MINEVRFQGQCDDRQFEPRPPLRSAPELQCSARLHSVDMAVNRLWPDDGQGRDPTIGSDGSEPSERMEAAGFPHGASGESLVRGEFSAMEAFDDLTMHSNGCWGLSQLAFTHIGVGRHEGYWTVDFAEHDPTEGTDGR